MLISLTTRWCVYLETMIRQVTICIHILKVGMVRNYIYMCVYGVLALRYVIEYEV